VPEFETERFKRPASEAQDNSIAIVLLNDRDFVQIYNPEMECRATMFRSIAMPRLPSSRQVRELGGRVKDGCSAYARLADQNAASYADMVLPERLRDRRDIVLRIVAQMLVARSLDASLKDKEGLGSWWWDQSDNVIVHDTPPVALMAR
jgi:hypothetical protein